MYIAIVFTVMCNSCIIEDLHQSLVYMTMCVCVCLCVHVRMCVFVCVHVHMCVCMIQARSQGGANGCNCTPPLDTRSARSAKNFVTSMFILLTIDTYSDSDNCQLSGNSSVALIIAHFRPTCT